MNCIKNWPQHKINKFCYAIKPTNQPTPKIYDMFYSILAIADTSQRNKWYSKFPEVNPSGCKTPTDWYLYFLSKVNSLKSCFFLDEHDSHFFYSVNIFFTSLFNFRLSLNFIFFCSIILTWIQSHFYDNFIHLFLVIFPLSLFFFPFSPLFFHMLCRQRLVYADYIPRKRGKTPLKG